MERMFPNMSTTNHKILISHEVPVSMLRYIEGKTDYQYALVHMFKNADYSMYFRDYLARGGRVILDNSLFELETMFDADKFAEAVNDIKPTEYIIPDAFNDSAATVRSAYDWNKKYSQLPGRKIGVIQGSSWRDLLFCYRELAPMVDKIAINFNPLGMDKQDLTHWGSSRFAFLRFLYESSLSNIPNILLRPLHLLGCSLPQEFEVYKSAPFRSYIETVDTSNPVLQGLNNKVYNSSWGILSKPAEKMNDLMDSDFPDKMTLEFIDANIEMFKNFVNGPSIY